MSVDLIASGLSKPILIQEFKRFLRNKAKEHFKSAYKELEFKEKNGMLWAGCKGTWERGCWFYFGNDGVVATTYMGRNGSDSALQELGIFELVKQYGGCVVEDSSFISWSYNKDKDKWEKT